MVKGQKRLEVLFQTRKLQVKSNLLDWYKSGKKWLIKKRARKHPFLLFKILTRNGFPLAGTQLNDFSPNYLKFRRCIIGNVIWVCGVGKSVSQPPLWIVCISNQWFQDGWANLFSQPKTFSGNFDHFFHFIWYLVFSGSSKLLNLSFKKRLSQWTIDYIPKA
mgnify:CR=1 FL=1